MITGSQLKEMILAFNGTEAVPHFERTGFRITGMRMFASYLEKDNTANVFLDPAKQKLFCEIDPQNIFPVPNKWGDKGATTFILNKVAKEILLEALLSAYNAVINSKKKK